MTENKTTPEYYSEDNYRWPKNLYEEVRDMASVAFLVYTFGYLRAGLRDLDKEECTKSTWDKCTKTENLSDDHVMGNSLDLTPLEVKNVIADHKTALSKRFGEFKESDCEEMFKSLDFLIKQAQIASSFASDMTEGSSEKDTEDRDLKIYERALTVQVYDDKFQKKELVYGICKDDINKRITLVFRGTDNALAMKSNWLADLNAAQTSFDVPSYLKGKIDDNTIKMHKGFYKYVFNKTLESNSKKTKYDEILDKVKEISKEYPRYKIYVTGHSLGAALSSVVSFFLSTEPEIPKPVSCINFASPRVGDYSFLQACQILEKEKQLRFLRVVNHHDTIAAAPTMNYHHAGFQLTLYEENPVPEIDYPKLNDGIWAKVKRGWNNSWMRSLNLGYDHGAYRERVFQCKDSLEKESLNRLYTDGERTGFTD